jgi:transposase
MPRPRKYPEELLERGARLAFESGRPIAHVAADLGVHPEALRKRVRQAEADAGGRRELLSSGEPEELAGLRREVKQLRKANEDATHYPPRGSPGAGAGGVAVSPVGGSLA